MSYLLAATTPDELLLMIAAEDGETRPAPYAPTETWNADTDPYFNHCPPVQAPGFCYLNATDNLLALHQQRLIYESLRQYHVIRLTWAGWDRVDELIAAGHRLPTEEERRKYAQRALVVVEGGDHGDLMPLDVPNPRGRSWLRRLLASDTAERA